MRSAEFEQAASSCMVAPVYSVNERSSLSTVAETLAALRVSALPVVDSSSRLTGLISKADLVRAGRLTGSASGEPVLWLPDRPVVEFMTTSVPVVRPGLPLWACAVRMFDQRTRRLYVVEDGPIEGVLSTREMMRAVVRAGVEVPVAELAAPVASIASSLALSSAHRALETQSYLVVTGKGVPLGVFSRSEAGNSREKSPDDAVSRWMDTSVVTCAETTAACVAADLALKTGARYIIAHDDRGDLNRVVSGLDFGRIVGMSALISPSTATAEQIWPGVQ